MIRYVAGNLHPNLLLRKLADFPTIERVSDMSFTQTIGVPISNSDKDKYNWAHGELLRRNISDGRYINSQHAVVANTQHVWPINALHETLFDDAMYFGPPNELRPGVIVRRYNLAPEVNRTRLADALCIEHSKFPNRDLYLDGVVVPELVDSHVPWKFLQICDLLMKVRQRLSIEDQLSINLSGELADLSWRQLNLLVDAGVKSITFERAGTTNHARRAAQAAGRLLLSDVLPVFDVKMDETIACQTICEVVGAAMAV